ncbi:MAG TPA: hypothetical protein VMH61_04770 [Candidatus Acidoferrales bacterium]|nr:hypothetical protein [Candidatus Acidoferrales bacterium]
MKRSTWAAVIVTAGVLFAAGRLPALDAGAALNALRAPFAGRTASRVVATPRPNTTATLPRRASPPPASSARAAAAASAIVHPAVAPVVRWPAAPLLLATPRPASRPGLLTSLPLSVFAALLAALFAALVALAWIALTLRPGHSRRRVFRLARGGQPAERIARLVRVPQDAVRTLLTPGLGVRR